MEQSTGAVIALAFAAAACGGGTQAPVTTASPPDEQATGPAATSRSLPRESPGASGAVVRLVNVWADPGGLGPTVLIRVSDDDSAQPLLQAAAGTVTDFVDVPVTAIFQTPADLEAISAEATDDDSARRISSLTRPVEEGDEVTVFAHGVPSGGEVSLGTFRHDGGSWPEMPADKVSLMVYPGALQPLPDDVNGVAIATTEGECLIDDTGQPNNDGWAGNIPKYFILEPGTTEIAVAHWPRSDCELEPTAGTVTVEGSAGDRVALIPWGTGADEIELMLIDMGSHP